MLSTLIIFILLFAVYINNQNKLTPVIQEVSQLPTADTTAEETDTTTEVNPVAPTPAQPAPAETAPATTPAETTPAPVAEVKPEPTKTEPAKPEPAKPEPTKAATGGVIVEYEIQKGDVMGRILSRFGNSKEEVMERNKLENLDKINLGQKLKMRVQAQHKVGKNETVSSLAAKYKVEADRIKKINGLSKDQLKADEVLIIPMP